MVSTGVKAGSLHPLGEERRLLMVGSEIAAGFGVMVTRFELSGQRLISVALSPKPVVLTLIWAAISSVTYRKMRVSTDKHL